MGVAIYARVSTFDQEPENQLAELRQYVTARGWTVGRVRRPGRQRHRRTAARRCDSLVAGARRRKFDVLLCWRLDRLGRNLRHLVMLLEELRVVGVAFVSLTGC